MESFEVAPPAQQEMAHSLTGTNNRIEAPTNKTEPKTGPLTCCPCCKGVFVGIVVKGRTQPARITNMKTPSDYGMDAYKNVDINSSDGIRLSAWEIEQPGTGRLAIVNHPLGTTRWGAVKGFDGVPVEFLPMVKHLYDAGFSIISYEQRGQGESDGGLAKTMKGQPCPVGVGSTEWQDMVGVLEYVKNHPTLKTNKIALMTQCMGANATMKAWSVAPEAFDLSKVKCMVALQPTNSFEMASRVTKVKVGRDLAIEVNARQEASVGFGFLDSAPTYVGAVKVPMLFAQVKDDYLTCDPGGINDVQGIYDKCVTEKQLIWIGPDQATPHGSGKRFEGYSYFNAHPQELIAFLKQYI